MADPRAHKFYCSRCNRFLYAETVLGLVTAVNYHAVTTHPADCSNWTVSGIAASVNYSSAGPLPQYLAPYNSPAKKTLTITEEDRKMLAAGRVRWD